MNEIPLTFGDDKRLMGILTLPDAAAARAQAFVLLNAGVIHRIGPHRINVKLARHLASLGFASLRFDLSGQGDSRAAQGSAEHAAQAVLDVRAAMDHLARTLDVHRFAVTGICSGADNAWATALNDRRVTSLCLIDGYHYPGPRTGRIWYRERLKGPILKAILPWLKRRAARLLSGGARSSAPPAGRPFPDRAVYTRDMQTLDERDVRMLLLFSGSLLPQYNHPEQFAETFAGHRFVERVEAEYRPGIDHTVTPLGAQRELLKRIGDWALSLK